MHPFIAVFRLMLERFKASLFKPLKRVFNPLQRFQ
ncbi:hypothetical protein predicted by Glimmer/Critica [Helicobacter pylori B8]|uniref:Uncharacterized protein n=1 Tax=Helicobacter pylori (strain B8) TaxID=693745 RepID=D7FFF5_HELP3|nr:hypothetical protein predicted by Glimmer/Critica [Helicobacter pylori B8]